ncbi:Gpi1-domain-containing protein [Panus rudis PR-1116 ss-1]|nr:Gpi1-domain-containing protein [Panus rudis PR-1116 ss-1]
MVLVIHEGWFHGKCSRRFRPGCNLETTSRDPKGSHAGDASRSPLPCRPFCGIYQTSPRAANLRMEQVASIPARFPTIYSQELTPSSVSVLSYVHFWNDVWLILNDIIIGTAVGTFLCENSDALSEFLRVQIEEYLVVSPQRALLWLNNWPAGLKLNTELSQFYCQTFLSIVIAWARILQALVLPHLSDTIWLMGALGMFGLTMTASAVSDLIGLLTMHLYIGYRVSAMIFSQQLKISRSLWNLFRGKRYNVLRKRTDSWDYDLDQLVLGTILFTLIAFLSPTVITYYALFALTRFMIILAHALLDTVLVLMNHFPLFALLLRMKSPLRMPGGIIYSVSDDHPSISIQPIPVSRIFDHYVQLGSRLTAHYHPLRLVRVIFGGGQLTTIPRSLIRLGRSVRG